MKTFHYYKMYQSGVSMEIEKLLLNSFAKCLSHADLKRIGYFSNQLFMVEWIQKNSFFFSGDQCWSELFELFEYSNSKRTK